MKRPDLDILACVNSEYQRFRLMGQDNLTGGAFATPTTVVCEALNKRKPFEMSPDLLKGAPTDEDTSRPAYRCHISRGGSEYNNFRSFSLLW